MFWDEHFIKKDYSTLERCTSQIMANQKLVRCTTKANMEAKLDSWWDGLTNVYDPE
jgi:hypothetical protein